MCSTPSDAMAISHSTMMGPKNLPMPCVPCFCTQNSRNSTNRVMGMTYSLKVGETTSRPSTADSTEMAGVITPSP